MQGVSSFASRELGCSIQDLSLWFFFRGDCGSCTLSVGGSKMKPCVAKVPPEPKLKSLLEKGLEIK